MQTKYFIKRNHVDDWVFSSLVLRLDGKKLWEGWVKGTVSRDLEHFLLSLKHIVYRTVQWTPPAYGKIHFRQQLLQLLNLLHLQYSSILSTPCYVWAIARTNGHNSYLLARAKETFTSYQPGKTGHSVYREWHASSGIFSWTTWLTYSLATCKCLDIL